MNRLRGFMPWPAAQAALVEPRVSLEAPHTSAPMQAARMRTDGSSCRRSAAVVALYIRTGICYV